MKRWLALFLAVVMVFSLTGCGVLKGIVNNLVDNLDIPADDQIDEPDDEVDESDEGDEPDEDPGDELGDDPGEDQGTGLEGDFYYYEGDYAAGLMLLDFQEIQFTWTAESSGDVSSWNYTHEYMGEEDVDGTPAKYFEVSIEEDGETKVYELWIGSEGNVLKGGCDGEYATGDMAVMYSFCLMYAFPIFTYSELFSEAFVEEDFGLYGWELSDRTTEVRDYGAGDVQVERFVFTYTWDEAAVEYEWEVANINGKNLFTKLKLDENDGNSADMNVERIIPF